MMSCWYNENDPFAAQWLRNLVAAGHIAPGDVDERDMREVGADEIGRYDQCHFFAGIGGWSLALRLAGWPDDRPVWTGSCPCQPFSTAGKRQGGADDRHLWPHWFNLIRECKPAIIFGEQVEAAIGWGWLDAVCADLEAEGYATGAAVLPACSVGAPHIRQRVWFVADADAARCGAGRAGETGDTDRHGSNLQDFAPKGQGHPVERSGVAPWSGLIWLPCSDGKARPTQPGLQPLAHGISGRVGRLRAYGNAIVPQVAAEFIAALS